MPNLANNELTQLLPLFPHFLATNLVFSKRDTLYYFCHWKPNLALILRYVVFTLF